MKTLKYSGQREAIKSFLASCRSHPTADMIYEGVREQYPQISLGTVYRNLSLLTELGEIIRFSSGDGKEHYDGYTKPHFHFICNSCGSISDVELPDNGRAFSAADYISGQLGAAVESEWTYAYGICKNCRCTEPSRKKN